MTVPHAEAREILVKGAGATVEGDDVVKIPRDAVAAARDTVPRDDPRVRPQRRARHGARRHQLVLRDRLGPDEHLRLRDRRAPSQRARRHGAHGAPLRRPPQHRLHHVGRAPARHRGLRVLPRVLPRHGQQHDQADGHDRRRRRGPRGHVEDRRGLPRRRGASCARSRTSSSTASPSARCSTPPRCSTSCSSAPTRASRSSTRRRRSPAPRRRSPTPATSCRPSPSRSSAPSSTSCACPAPRCSPAWARSSST